MITTDIHISEKTAIAARVWGPEGHRATIDLEPGPGARATVYLDRADVVRMRLVLTEILVAMGSVSEGDLVGHGSGGYREVPLDGLV